MYDYNFKIVLFGDKGTGKRSLAKLISKIFNGDSTMTTGVDFYVKSLEIDGDMVKLQVWLLTGEERFRFHLPLYVRSANGGIFVYDVTNYNSLIHLDDWLMLVKKEIRAENQFPIIVVGNKADLVDKREVSGEEGIQFAKSRGVAGFIECSTKTRENVEDMFEALARVIIQKWETH